MKISTRFFRNTALAFVTLGLTLGVPALAEERGFLPLFSEGGSALSNGSDARFGVFLRSSTTQDALRLGQRLGGEHPTLGRVAFGARLANRPIAAHIGLSDMATRDRVRELQVLPLTLGVDVGNFERFLFSGEVMLPTRLQSGEVRGRISSSSVWVNASFRF